MANARAIRVQGGGREMGTSGGGKATMFSLTQVTRLDYGLVPVHAIVRGTYLLSVS